MAKRLLAHEDNAVGNLSAGISAATLTIPLDTGDGALFPTTYSGAATSGGDSNTLNDTGIGATGIAVGDIIENITDGSYAIVVSVAADTIETTPLVGGSGNTWDNADVWIVNRFVITVIHYDTDGTTILKREKMLIDTRSGDTLTVNASGRGYDGSSAQSFSTADYVYQFTMAASFDGVRQVVSDMMRTASTLADLVSTKISQNGSQIYAASSTGNDTYVITLSPAPSALVAGFEVNFLADVANTGAATLNVNGLGAKSILSTDGVTALDDNDIKAGCVAHVIYDGTSFQLQTPPSATLSNAIATEVTNVFSATDVTGAELETLTSGPTSDASQLHKHAVSFKRLTYDMSTASGSSTIAHGLGVAPKNVKITAFAAIGAAVKTWSVGTYDGTTTQSNTIDYGNATAETSGTYVTKVGRLDSANYQTATIAVDATNVTLTWTKTGTPTGNAYLLIESFA